MAAESRIHLFEFRGRAEIMRRIQDDRSLPNESQIVRYLDDNSPLIAQTIRDQLTVGLTPSLSVQVQIHFYEGSISLAGVIILLDTIGALAATSDFVTTFSRLIEIAIHGVMQKWIIGEMDADRYTASIQVEVKQPMRRQRSRWISVQNLAVLVIANTILLLILILLLIPFVVRNPTPSPASTATPPSTLSFTPTLTPSFTPTLTPSLTPTNTPSITPFP